MIGRIPFRLIHLTAELLAATLLGLSLLSPAAAENPAPARDVPSAGKSGPDTLQSLLPLLLTSENRKQLAADLEASIRQGDLKAAEASLNTAIEVGTLAIVLADHLHNPDLLRALQDLGIQGDGRSSSTPPEIDKAVSESCASSPTPSTANLAELQEALEQEHSNSTMASQRLAALMQEHNALTARIETEAASQTLKVSEMQQALQQEQKHKEALGAELERLREEHRILVAAREQGEASASSQRSELETLLRQAREQGDAAMGQLAGLRQELDGLRAARNEEAASQASRVSELEHALAQARRRSDVLMQELADTADTLRALREPQQTGPAPLVFRLASTGTEPTLPPVPQDSVAQEVTSALPGPEPAAVMVASLPESIQPLPLPAMNPDPVRAETRSGPSAEPARADDRLVARADELLRKGDVSGARLLLERAMGNGSARAAFLLAETFDPNVLSRLGALGMRGDAAKARELYARAQAMGAPQAGERMEALK